jgi:hypothetical protein
MARFNGLCQCGTRALSRRKEITFTTCLGLLPSSFVPRSLQIHADMRLARASLADKIPAASCKGYFFTAPNKIAIALEANRLGPHETPFSSLRHGRLQPLGQCWKARRRAAPRRGF